MSQGHRVVTIASGGCNMLAYLTRSPERIDAVDLNAAHIALNRMKLEAVRHLPSQADLFRFFGEAGNQLTIRQPMTASSRRNLDAGTRRYWEAPQLARQRRIAAFDRNFYRTGLLGLFIAAGHRVARLYGVDPTRHARSEKPRRPAPLLRRGTGADLRKSRLIRLRHVAEVLAVRPRHPAGAV